MSIHVFYRNAVSHLVTTGSIAPSSRYLTEAMIRMVKPEGEPLRVLEAGPGTGPFSIPLLRKLRGTDRFDLCELNEDFVVYLRGLFEKEPEYLARREYITLHHKPVQELEGNQVYDYIVSSLPFNNFEPELVADILENYKRMIKPGGLISFFEYAFFRHLKQMAIGGKEGQRIRKIGDILEGFVREYSIEQQFVALNIPPARVYIQRMP